MARTKKSAQKLDTKRREFKSTSDILEFERELTYDELTDKEVEELGLAPRNRISEEGLPIEEQKRIDELKQTLSSKNLYYNSRSGKFIQIPDKKYAVELQNTGEVISYEEYLKREIDKQNPTFQEVKSPQPLEPIIFEKKGKTPPSVPYLNVYVMSDIEGDIKSLHQIHSKTRHT